MAYDEQIAQRVRDVLSEECTADEKRMFGGIAFLVNGHMCCGVVGQDLVVRIGADEHEMALSQPYVRPAFIKDIRYGVRSLFILFLA